MRIAAQADIDSLTPDELSIMDQAQKMFNDRIKVNCTGCEYCMPCPFGVNIPRNFSLYNEYHLFDSEDIKAEKKKEYSRLSEEEKASTCTECGACELLCPQSILIRERLKDVTHVL